MSSQKVVIPREEVSKISKLVAGADHNFLAEFDGKDFGYVRYHEKIIDMMYGEAKRTKDELVDRYVNSADATKKEQVKKLIVEVFQVLMDLEHKYHLLISLERRYFSVNGNPQNG